MGDYGGTLPAGEAAARTPAAPVQRSAPEEFGRLFLGAGRVWSLARPLVFAAGLGLLSWGAGMALMQQSAGPGAMGLGGVLAGLGLFPRRRP